MVISLVEAKEYLRIDGNDEDTLINSLILTSEEYIKNATASDVDLTKELAKLASKLLVSHWYENREPTGKADKLSFSLQSIFVQLQYCAGGVTV